MNFSTIAAITIPEGKVVKITDANGNVIWGGTSSMATALIDWEYTESNGTYTLTAWKGTRNGVPSTECVVPNYSNVIL